MPPPSHHSPHFVLVQAVPVTGQRMANRRWSPLDRIRLPLASLLALRLELPWVMEAAKAEEQAVPT
jgi:hypothetical protein